MTKVFFDFCEKSNIKIEDLVLWMGIASIVLIVLVIILLVLQISINSKYKKFMSGSDGKSLEEEICTKIEKFDAFNSDVVNIKSEISKIKDNLLITIQKVGIVKYDAFKEMGGKLSFALALLSSENNGVVINSVHSREGCYTYIKEIVKGESFVLLGEEEKEAVKKAIKGESDS